MKITLIIWKTQGIDFEKVDFSLLGFFYIKAGVKFDPTRICAFHMLTFLSRVEPKGSEFSLLC